MASQGLKLQFGPDVTEESDQRIAPGQSTGVMPSREYTMDEAFANVPKTFVPSAIEVGKSFVQPFIDPIGTAQAMGEVGKGVYSKAKGLVVDQPPEQKAKDEAALNAVASHYGRYFSGDTLKRAIAEDPAGVLADVGGLFTLGAGTAARLPGKVGSVASKVAKASEYIDPVALTGKTVSQIPKLTAIPFSFYSGASYDSLADAAKAGATKNAAFMSHLSGQADIGEVAQSVRNTVYDMMDQRGKQYQADMARIGKNPAVLPYNDIMNTFDRLEQGTKSVGKIYDEPTFNALKQAEQKIIEWWGQPSAQGAHTIYDFDKLKRSIGRIRDDYRPGSPEHKALGTLYDSVKNTINTADPEYGKIMDAYAAKSQEINDIMREITLGNSASQPARIRKLLKAKKDPLTADLIERLAKQDPDLPMKLAGEELKGGMPQGLRGYLSASGGLLYGAPVATLAASSPKVGGYAQYGLGAAGRYGQNAVSFIPESLRGPEARAAAYQVGEIARNAQEPTREPEPASEYEPMRITVPVGAQPQRANGGRVERASGGRIEILRGVRALMQAAENAKKSISKSTEPLLDQPDENIAQALHVAKKNI
jgi:hypothetical protein